MADRLKVYGCILLIFVAVFSGIVIPFGFQYNSSGLRTPAIILSAFWGIVLIVGAVNFAREKVTNKDKAIPTRLSIDRSQSEFQGDLGEPYCSSECYKKGGEYASSVMLKNQSGNCGFCESPVQASMYGEANCAVIPYEGVTLFVCKSCVSQAQEYMKTIKKCCYCQKAL